MRHDSLSDSPEHSSSTAQKIIIKREEKKKLSSKLFMANSRLRTTSVEREKNKKVVPHFHGWTRNFTCIDY